MELETLELMELEIAANAIPVWSVYCLSCVVQPWNHPIAYLSETIIGLSFSVSNQKGFSLHLT